MAGTKAFKDVNPSFTKEVVVIDPVQTTNATPLVAYSIPVKQNRAITVKASFVASVSDFSNCASGDGTATFRRQTGNLARTNITTAGLLLNILGDFLLSQPTVDLVANTTTQAVDVTVTGKLGLTVNWNIEIESKYTN